jgi:hypothetical protein
MPDEDLKEQMEKHEANDEQRFAVLDLRLGNMERKVALGSFLGVVMAEAVARGVMSFPEVLRALAESAAPLVAMVGL